MCRIALILSLVSFVLADEVAPTLAQSVGEAADSVQEDLPLEEQAQIQVEVDAQANIVRTQKPAKKMSDAVYQGGIQMLLLQTLDMNKDGCVDQSEFVNHMVLDPFSVEKIGKAPPEDWSLALLQGTRLPPVKPDGSKYASWCPRDKLIGVKSPVASDKFNLFGPKEDKELLLLKKKCPEGAVRNDNTAKKSCPKLLDNTIGQIPVVGTWAAKVVGKVFGQMCEELFPGPCVYDNTELGMPYVRMAISGVKACRDSGWTTQKIMEDNRSTYDADYDNATKIYHPPTAPHMPSNDNEEKYRCGANDSWTGDYWEKDISIADITASELFNGEGLTKHDFAPLTAWLAMLKKVFDMPIIQQMIPLSKGISKLNDQKPMPTELSVYLTTDPSDGNGICMIVFQETQDSDDKVNFAADLVGFKESSEIKGKAHRGYVRAYENLKDIVKTYYDDHCSNGTKYKTIMFAGYSAGGGMAAVNWVHAKKTYGFAARGQTPVLITAGTPFIGDEKFCDSNFKKGDISMQIAAEGDIVVGSGKNAMVDALAGVMQIHHCTKLHWVDCAPSSNSTDCHSLSKTYSEYSKTAPTEQCDALGR